MAYKVVEERCCNNKETGVMADQIVEFTSRVAKKGYPKAIRCITIIAKSKMRLISS